MNDFLNKDVWNNDDWQGRRKDQIEGAYQNFFIVILFLLVFLTGWACYDLYVQHKKSTVEKETQTEMFNHQNVNMLFYE